MKIVLFILLFTGFVNSTNYYFADAARGGSAGNDGLTPSTPKVSLASIPGALNAGDSVLFKRASSWTIATISVPSSGSVGSPIVFGAYGTGAAPVLDCGTYKNTWTLAEGNIYKSAQASDPEGVINTAIDTCVRMRDSTYAQLLAQNTTGEWFWNGIDTLYLVAPSQPADWTVMIKYGAEVFLVNNKEYVTIQDLTIQGIGSTYGGVFILATGTAKQGITIQRCTFPFSNNEAIYLYNTQGAIVRDNTIKNSWNGAPYGHTYKTPRGGGIIIINSLSNNNAIYRNYINNCYEGIHTEGGTLNDTISLNIITNSLVNSINMSNNAKSNPTKVFNNTIVHNPSFTSGHGIVVQGSGKGGAIIKNNIVTCPYTGTNVNVECISLLDDTATTVNNNNYYLPAGSTGVVGNYGGHNATLADWQTAIAATGIKGKDSLSLSTDPELDSLYKTPALNQCATAGVNVGLTLDYFGNTIDPSRYPIGINATAKTPASITVQPTSGSRLVGETAELSVTATGSGTLTYQWYHGEDSSAITSATDSAYTTPALTAGTTTYFVRVLSDTTPYVQSNTVSVVTKQAAVISIDPISQTINNGVAGAFSVYATGTGSLSYQWQKGGSNIEGATSAAYSFTADKANHLAEYRCIVTGDTTGDTSAVAVLSVKNVWPAGTRAVIPLTVNHTKIGETATNFLYQNKLILTNETSFKNSFSSAANITIFDTVTGLIRPSRILYTTKDTVYIYFDGATSTAADKIFFVCAGLGINRTNSSVAFTNSNITNYWGMNDVESPVLDYADGANGAVVGATLGATGQFGSCISFLTGSNYVFPGALPSLKNTSTFTIGVIVNMTGFTSVRYVFARFVGATDLNFLKFNTSGYLQWQLYSSADSSCIATSTTSINTGNWHIIFAVFDGSQGNNSTKMKLYIDGQLTGCTFTGNSPSFIPDNISSTTIFGNPANSLTGGLDEPLTSSDAYTAGRVTSRYEMMMNPSTFWTQGSTSIVSFGKSRKSNIWLGIGTN